MITTNPTEVLPAEATSITMKLLLVLVVIETADLTEVIPKLCTTFLTGTLHLKQVSILITDLSPTYSLEFTLFYFKCKIVTIPCSHPTDSGSDIITEHGKIHLLLHYFLFFTFTNNTCPVFSGSLISFICQIEIDLSPLRYNKNCWSPWPPVLWIISCIYNFI